jgi:hypothetical protein
MNYKNKLFCIPIAQIPLLLQITNDYFFISYFVIAASLIVLILRSIQRGAKKMKVGDNLFWILSAITLSFIIFAALAFNLLSLPTSSLYSIASSYLLIYVFFFGSLFLEFIILKIFLKIKINIIYLFILGLFLIFFLALYMKLINFSPETTFTQGLYSFGSCDKGEQPFF